MKRFLLLPALCAALQMSAAESSAPAAPADFIRGEQLLSAQNGVLTISKSSDLYCKQRMPIDPAKRYRLSGEFRQTGNSGTCIVRFGVIPSTSQRQIIPASINVRPGTETELVADCSAKDTVIKVKNADKWSATPLDRVVFDIDPSPEMRDLPNFNIAKSAIKSIAAKGYHYEITLTAPCGMNFAAGTPVRIHRIGWIAMFCCGANNKLTGEWKKLSHTFETGTVAVDNIFRWWRGTEIAQIYLTFSIPAGQKVEFRNLRLEEIAE
ncbi:MAG: hypothetical protein E7058_08675 [Lentisphaerae bacterium]|nr:hypothetical protein [Lentisphaerota bacterium]